MLTYPMMAREKDSFISKGLVLHFCYYFYCLRYFFQKYFNSFSLTIVKLYKQFGHNTFCSRSEDSLTPSTFLFYFSFIVLVDFLLIGDTDLFYLLFRICLFYYLFLFIIYYLFIMLSSLKLTSTTPLGKDQYKKIKTIWQSLHDNNDSPQFRVPVDWKGMGLIDYPKIVKNPMDLSSIHQKMKQDRYNTVEEVLDDIQLIWDNCRSYNEQGSWIYDLSQKLERSFKKMVKTYLPSIQLPQQNAQKAPPVQPPPKEQEQITYQDKIKFTERIKKLGAEDLGQLVKAIMSVCPPAFRQVDEEKAQIFVDNMDILSFKEINEILGNIEEEEDLVNKRVKM